MSENYRLIRDLDAYVRLRTKKDTAITLKLKDKIAQMNSDELHIA